MNISITKKVRSAGEYYFQLSNGHMITIQKCSELAEWHFFAHDRDGHSYEPVHPFYDTFGDAKSQISEALRNIQNRQVSMASPDWTN
tara:strand:+ start:8917 stop:9177 length:261 start_codon:yes stop_codon:yes gene_type:complete